MYESSAPTDGRIIQIFGHRHAWTPRLAAWLNDELVYDSWDWRESVTFNYDSITTNPPINTEGKVDGAKSGPVPFKTGDRLKYACFIENGSDETLQFRNELKGGRCATCGVAPSAAASRDASSSPRCMRGPVADT